MHSKIIVSTALVFLALMFFTGCDLTDNSGVKVTKPAAPDTLAATAASFQRINLTWNDNSDNEEGFRIERAADNGGSPGTFSEIASVPANTAWYSNAGLAESTAYHYRVCAFNSAGDSSFSDVDHAETPAFTESPAQIIADHSAVDLFIGIPAEYIDEVKKMWINIPGESHSAAYRTGLTLLAAETGYEAYAAVATEDSSDPEAYTDQHLRTSGHVHNIYGWSYGCGERGWYTWYAYDAASQPEEKDLIEDHIQYSDTHSMVISAIGFGWCWDATWHNDPTEAKDTEYLCGWAGSSDGGPDGDLPWGLDAGDYSITGNRVSMDTYLDATEGYRLFCVDNSYSTRVIFTTGPVDGSAGSESGYQRHLKHEHIRNFVKEEPARILFDYADILCYDNGSDTPETSTWTDGDGTVHEFPGITDANVGDADIGHIGRAGAIRLAKAQWWLLARIAGWDGN